MLNPELEKYIEYHTSDEDELLYSLDRETNIKTTMPRMLSGKVQGKFLEMLATMIKPERILEIGTFTGYSALCLAKGLTPTGKLYTIESNVEMEEFILNYIRLSESSSKIEVIIGDAINEIPKINDTFDLVFIDADKEQYTEYYELVKEKLHPGGYIIADNVIWSGKVLNKINPDKETKAIQKFNDHVNQDKDVEQVMLSVRDGLMLIRKLPK
ncbi:MAG: O-methyltransferase [Bacteroidetes bacterium]|nr:O-methyltransferase [Bacteroidota bacterium]